jgi:putative ABC transport system permease protein
VLVIANNGDSTGLAFKRDIAAMPAVEATALASSVPGRTYNSAGNDLWPADVVNNKGQLQRISFAFYDADADFLPFYKIKLLAGRNFYKDTHRDSAGVIINKTAALNLGYTEATLGQVIGKRFGGSGDAIPNTVIGVIDDFHFHSLKDPITPLSLQTDKGYWQFLSVKVNTANLPGTIKALAGQWEKSVPNRPFSYFFLNEDFDSQYGAEERFGRLFIYFSILALFISSLGLLGLSAYSTLQRTREIGIRKVLGSSVWGIVGLLSGDFVKLVVIAFVIACPLSWVAMHQWLQGFAYRTTLNGGLFALAGAGALLIAVLTISFQAIKAALASPVKSLKTE